MRFVARFIGVRIIDEVLPVEVRDDKAPAVRVLGEVGEGVEGEVVEGAHSFALLLTGCFVNHAYGGNGPVLEVPVVFVDDNIKFKRLLVR